MPHTSTKCPRCHQPVVANIERLFDANTDPTAKQRLLSGSFNYFHCPSCGFEGMLGVPIVYHDPEKELLLTFFPPNLGLSVNEQERSIGLMINQVLNQLPSEKRKGYLLRPKTMLTMESMIEHILEADGITREMIQSQQKRINLIQQLLNTPKQELGTIIHQEEQTIDNEFFAILSRLIGATIAQGDQKKAQQLTSLQQDLFENTEVGSELQTQLKETQEAIKSLQKANQKGLTREKLLELVIAAPTETRLTTLVSLARSGLDYTFFQMLTKRIDETKGEEHKKLMTLRENLLDKTDEIDRLIKEQYDQAQKLLQNFLDSPKIEEMVAQNAAGINNFFIEVLNSNLDKARQENDLERINKLQEIINIVQKYMTPPPEIALIEELLSADNDNDRQKILEDHQDLITPELLQTFNDLVVESKSMGRPSEVQKKMQESYRAALRFSMEANLRR